MACSARLPKFSVGVTAILRSAEIKISASLSRVTSPAELNEMVQYCVDRLYSISTTEEQATRTLAFWNLLCQVFIGIF